MFFIKLFKFLFLTHNQVFWHLFKNKKENFKLCNESSGKLFLYYFNIFLNSNNNEILSIEIFKSIEKSDILFFRIDKICYSYNYR